MNKKILYVGLAIFLIAVVSCVCMNVVHASTFDPHYDDEHVYDGYYNTKSAKDYGADYIIDKRADDDYIIHDVKVKNYDKYIEYGTKVVIKTKTFKGTYVTYNDGGMVNQANAKGAKKVLKIYFDENYKYGMSKGLKKAVKFYDKGDKLILKVEKIKTGYKKIKDFHLKTVKVTKWKTVKWNSVSELWRGVLKLPNGYKYSYNTYSGKTVYSHYKKVTYKDVKQYYTTKLPFYKYKVVAKVKYEDYKYVKKIVNKPCKVAYVY